MGRGTILDSVIFVATLVVLFAYISWESRKIRRDACRRAFTGRNRPRRPGDVA